MRGVSGRGELLEKAANADSEAKRERSYAQGYELGRSSLTLEMQHLKSRNESLANRGDRINEQVRLIEKALGVSTREWGATIDERKLRSIAQAVQAVVAGADAEQQAATRVEQVMSRLQMDQNDLENAAVDLQNMRERILAEWVKQPPTD